MKKPILFCILSMCFTQPTNAQKSVISTYFSGIVSELKKPENVKFTSVKFIIQVMSYGKVPTDSNEDYWFSAFGVAESSINRTKTNISTGKFGGISLTNRTPVTYWFNDRQWTESEFRGQFSEGCCKDNFISTPGVIDLHQCYTKGISKSGFTYPFSYSGKENGQLIIGTGISLSPVEILSLFKEWNWNVSKCFILKNTLYGELTNGHTFSMSYRFNEPIVPVLVP